MAKTLSNECPANFTAPNFELIDTISGELKTLTELKGTTGTVILFICNHCPFVIHINPMLVKLANEYRNSGIQFIAISSNDVVNYPQDSPDRMKVHAQENDYSFPYLYDETQEVAKAYDAACTPDIYLFDKDLELFYHGQLDDARPGNGKPVTGKDLKNAMESLLVNKPLDFNVKPSMGCNIKWK